MHAVQGADRVATGYRAEQPVLEVENLSKSFPGQIALDDLAIRVDHGQIHALLGQNGSGKSTLIKILTGYHRADPGASARLLGEPLPLDGNVRDTGRIHVMHQDLGLIDSMNAAENLAIGRGFEVSTIGRVRWRRQLKHTRDILASLGATFDVRTPVGNLSASERAIVALGRAIQDLGTDGRGLLILDEPTVALSRPDVLRLFEAVRAVARSGAGVLFVSHRLDEVMALAQHVTVLRDGRVVASQSAASLDHDGLVELIVGRPIDALYAAPPPAGSETVLSVENLWGSTIEGLDLRVRAGEIVGVAGLVGSGRDELCPLLFGSLPRAAGRIRINGADTGRSPRRSLVNGMALVPADRKRLGSIASQPVRQNVTLGLLRPVTRWSKLSVRRERRDVGQWARRVDIQPVQPERLLETFSGGNQQKAVLARCLRRSPRVLLLDEPTQGVDIGAKAAIYELLADTAADDDDRGAGRRPGAMSLRVPHQPWPVLSRTFHRAGTPARM